MNQQEREAFFSNNDKTLSRLSSQEEMADLFQQFLEVLETSKINVVGNPLDNDFNLAIDILKRGTELKKKL